MEIERKTSAIASHWLSALPDAHTSVRIFAFPYAGGGPAVFRGWADFFAPHSAQICPVALPGREKRMAEPLITDMPELTEAIFSAMRPFLDKPYALLGLCFGACIAFELARRATVEGLAPARLITVGGRAPHAPPPVPVQSMDDKEFIATLELLRFIPSIVLENADLLALYLPLLRADFSLDEFYHCGEPLPAVDFPITALVGQDDRVTPAVDIQAWEQCTSGPFHLHYFDGDQLFFVTRRDEVLEHILEDCLRVAPV